MVKISRQTHLNITLYIHCLSCLRLWPVISYLQDPKPYFAGSQCFLKPTLNIQYIYIYMLIFFHVNKLISALCIALFGVRSCKAVIN